MNNVEKSARQFVAYLNGGKGSGNWNHRGRKGLVGGSAPKSAGTSSHLSSSKREAIKNMTDEEFDKEMSDFTNKRFSDFNRRKQAILGGKGGSVADVVEAITAGRQLELASPEQLTKLRDFENKFNQETKEIRAEYYKARYNGLDEGYYRDSRGNVVYVSGDYDYPDGFTEYGRKQMFYQVGSNQNRDSVEYIMSDNEKKNYKKVSRNEALASLKDGETLGGISQSEQRIIDAYIHSPLLSYALRNGEKVSSAKELKSVIDRTKGEAGTYYRGVTGDYANELRNMNVGDTFTDKGFASSSLDRNVAQRFTGNDGLIITIISDGGFGTGMQLFSYNSNNINYINEQEFLFNQDSEFRVLSKNNNEIIVKLES